jgi:hypothetical protein
MPIVLIETHEEARAIALLERVAQLESVVMAEKFPRCASGWRSARYRRNERIKCIRLEMHQGIAS